MNYTKIQGLGFHTHSKILLFPSCLAAKEKFFVLCMPDAITRILRRRGSIDKASASSNFSGFCGYNSSRLDTLRCAEDFIALREAVYIALLKDKNVDLDSD